MTVTIGKTELQNMFAQAAAQLRSENRRLSELDSIGGDGDHGTTMLRAAEQMEAWPREPEDESLAALLKAVGWRVLSIDGGASSSLLGTFFSGMGDVALSRDSMDATQLAQSLQAGLHAVGRQTKAKPGDKTMMDALSPAIAAASAAAEAGKAVPKVLQEAAAAAQSGAESTRNLVARYGRARSLGERTRGHPDAGATSIALIFKGFREGVNNAGS
ncbi:MAG TPA: dihydroxyacetone kinase subunit DhaL [Acidobacteriaceae bacterium]|nr:dihydroxyacetone kinase subunit DhaL [Acidobacteriaceae bacterium]